MIVKHPGTERSLLILVDVQEKLAQVMWQREQLIRQLEILVQGCQGLDIPIVWCQQVPKALGPTVPELTRHLQDLTPINKTTFSCWGEPAFRDQIIALGYQNRDHVMIAGIESHVCVYQTARDLLDCGHSVEVIADAVSSRTPENCMIGLERMVQVGVQKSSVEMVLFDLLQDSRHSRFRDVARFVK